MKRTELRFYLQARGVRDIESADLSLLELKKALFADVEQDPSPRVIDINRTLPVRCPGFDISQT